MPAHKRKPTRNTRGGRKQAATAATPTTPPATPATPPTTPAPSTAAAQVAPVTPRFAWFPARARNHPRIFWGILGIVVFLVVGMMIFFKSSSPAVTETATALPNHTMGFMIATILVVIGLVVYRWFSGSWPSIAVAAALLGTIVVNWAWWGLHPGSWNQWEASNTFWPMIAAMILAGIFTGHQHALAKLATILLIGLVGAGVILGAYWYNQKDPCWAAIEKNAAATECHAVEISSAVSNPEGAVPDKFTGNARDYAGFNGPERTAVIEFFKENPVMADIAAAETHFTQWSNPSKKNCEGVLMHRNNDGTYDRGVMSINQVHWSDAKRKGYDLCQLTDNMMFAAVLFKEQHGTTPWNSSRKIWESHYASVLGAAEQPIQQTPSSQSGATRVAREGTEREDTLRVPTDGTWSDSVFTRGMRLKWDNLGKAGDYQMQYKRFRDGTVHEFTVRAKDARQENALPDYPVWVRFKGDSIAISLKWVKIN